MSAETPQSEDDLEMLAAIRAAFGDDALDLIADDEEPSITASEDADTREQEAVSESSVSDTPSLSLDELIQEIDSTVADDTPTSQQETAPVSETEAKASPASLAASLATAGMSPSPTASEQGLEKYLLIQIHDHVFGIAMDNVHEIQRLPKITFLPGVPEWVLGVTNLRGNVFSVVDLKQLLSIEASEENPMTCRLVMAHSLVDDVATGLIVDRVIGVRNLDPERVMKTTAPVNDNIARYIDGMIEVDDRLAVLLDIDKLLLSDQFRQFDAA